MQSTFLPLMEPAAAHERRRGALLLWLSSAALGVAAAEVLYAALPGIGWPLLVVACATALVALERPDAVLLRSRRYAAIGLACLLSGAAAVTADPAVEFLLLVGIVWLGAVAGCLARGLPERELGAGRLAGAPFMAPMLVAREATRVVGEGVSTLASEESVPPLRGIALAVPVVALLFLLLGEADPTFAAVREAIRGLLMNLSGLGRAVFGLIIATGCLGYLNLARRQAVQPAVWRETRVPAPRHTDLERLIVLGSVATLFAVFLLLQVSYLFGNPGARVGSGVTLAEAVHRGFTEMSLVVAFVAALLAVLERRAYRGARGSWVAAVSALVIIECLVLLASAYFRLMAYEAAYGYTEPRIYVRLYIGFLAATIVLLAFELARGIDAARLCWRVSVAALGALAVLGYWNYSAWIVDANLERYARSGQLDLEYLAQTGTNGLPALAGSLARLDPPQRARLVGLVCGGAGARCGLAAEPEPAWFEWNLRRATARHAREELSHVQP